jgi:hypothetical protein
LYIANYTVKLNPSNEKIFCKSPIIDNYHKL